MPCINGYSRQPANERPHDPRMSDPMTPTDVRDRLIRLPALNHQRHEEEVEAERMGKGLL